MRRGRRKGGQQGLAVLLLLTSGLISARGFVLPPPTSLHGSKDRPAARVVPGPLWAADGGPELLWREQQQQQQEEAAVFAPTDYMQQQEEVLVDTRPLPWGQGGKTAAAANTRGRASAAAAAVVQEVPDEHQAAAILTPARYAVLVSGAGTGKTRVLASRMAHLIASGACTPSQVLILSFSKAAAQSIQAKADDLLAQQAAASGEYFSQDASLGRGAVAGTFHALAASILRAHSSSSRQQDGQQPPQLRILSKAEQLEVMRGVLWREEGHRDVGDAKALLRHVSLWKAAGARPQDVDPALCLSKEESRACRVYPAYQRALREHGGEGQGGALDLDDLLLAVLDLFQQEPQVLESVRGRYRHILVDEFQDTNAAQYALLKALALGPTALTPPAAALRNDSSSRPSSVVVSAASLGPCVFCAGDDDQSIYSFQGARAGRAFSAFLDDFPGAVAIGLRTSYRLPSHLFAAAKKVIERNDPGRFDKLEETACPPAPMLRLDYLDRDALARIAVQETWDDRDEARWIAKRVADYYHHHQALRHNNNNHNHKQQPSAPAGGVLSRVAVLVRSSWQLRVLEEAFAQRAIPYVLAGRLQPQQQQQQQQPQPSDRMSMTKGLDLEAAAARARAVLRLVDGQGPSDWEEEMVLRRAAAAMGWEGSEEPVLEGVMEVARDRRCGYVEAACLVLDGQPPHTFPPEHWLPRLVDGLRGGRWAWLLHEAMADGGQGLQEALLTVMEEAGLLANTPTSSWSEAAAVEAVCGRAAVRWASRARGRAGQAATGLNALVEVVAGEGGEGQQQQEEEEEEVGAVVLGTMHEAKGREFDLVFLPGWDEGVFPIRPKTTATAQDDNDNSHGQTQTGWSWSWPAGGSSVESSASQGLLKEERRLAYVALTRARVNAFITYCNRRQVGSKVVACSPSRFLKELPVQLVRFSFLGPLKKAASFKSSVDNHLRTFLQQFQPAEPTASSSMTPEVAAPEPPPPPPSGPLAHEPLTLGDRPLSLDHLPLRTGLDSSQDVAAAAPSPEEEEEEEPPLSSMEAAEVELPEQHAEKVMLVEAAEPAQPHAKPRGRRKKAVVEGEGEEDVGSVVAGLLSQAWVAKEDLRPFYLAIVQHVLAQQQQQQQQQDDDEPPAAPSSGKRGRKQQQQQEAAIPVPPLVPGKPARSRRVSVCSAEELGLFAVEQAVQGHGPWQAASQALRSVLKKVLQLYGRAVPTKKEGGGSAEELGRRVTEALWDHRRFKAGGSKKEEVGEGR